MVIPLPDFQCPLPDRAVTDSGCDKFLSAKMRQMTKPLPVPSPPNVWKGLLPHQAHARALLLMGMKMKLKMKMKMKRGVLLPCYSRVTPNLLPQLKPARLILTNRSPSRISFRPARWCDWSLFNCRICSTPQGFPLRASRPDSEV